VEGRLLEFAGPRVHGRARGYLTSLGDIEQVGVGVEPAGTPILVRDVARVQPRPRHAPRRRRARRRGEVVGGIVIMRFGENALRVIDR
jgi:copper/silver efflux system protein